MAIMLPQVSGKDDEEYSEDDTGSYRSGDRLRSRGSSLRSVELRAARSSAAAGGASDDAEFDDDFDEDDNEHGKGKVLHPCQEYHFCRCKSGSH